MNTKRMRVFAGPNGSGKTTIIKSLQDKIPLGVYVNADEIELILKETKELLFSTFQLVVTQVELQTFFRKSTFAPVKRAESDLWTKIKVVNNILHTNATIDSYLAADIAEFIRQRLLADEISFSYETVMSHKSKIDFLKQAQKLGYKVYLYFVSTENPEINISRINVRVAQKGHFVTPEKVNNRYFKSLNQLKSAVKNSNIAYLWDNSGEASILFAIINNGSEVELIDTSKCPNWFVKYLLNNI